MTAATEQTAAFAPGAATHGAPNPVARLVRRWRHLPDRRLVTSVLGIWAGSRLALLLAAWCASWTSSAAPLHAQGPFLKLFAWWDGYWYVDVAQHGYFYGPDQGDPFGRVTYAFLPGEPWAIRAVHLVVRDWVVSGLLVSLLAGAVAVVALARLAAYELPHSSSNDRGELGRRAVLLLVLSPYAVFLLAPYAEPLFLAFALTGWLAARRGQFVRAGVLIALASLVKVNGLFVLAAVLVEYAGQARRTGRPLLRRDGLALLSPLVSIGGYVIWLQGRTGDWSAWQHAQQHAWQRYWTAPWSSISMTWHRAFADPRGSDFRWAWRAELLAAVVGLVLLVVLVRMRRWAEAVYVLLAWGTLVTDGLFFSIPRSTLLLWPLWLLLARATLRRQWLQPVLLWCMAPLCLALTFAFVTHHWVN